MVTKVKFQPHGCQRRRTAQVRTNSCWWCYSEGIHPCSWRRYRRGYESRYLWRILRRYMLTYMMVLTMKSTPSENGIPHCRFSCIQGCYAESSSVLLSRDHEGRGYRRPEDYMGDVIGDINSRRGRNEGMEDNGGGKMIRGYVPLSEMFGYATDSLFQNTGTW